MVLAPSQRMRTLAARWLTDTITVQSQTAQAPTRAEMADGTLVYGPTRTARALARQTTTDLVDGVTVRHDVRLLTVWVSDDTVAAGERVNFVSCSDASLNGKRGTVETVDRDDVRAVRRMMVRLSNDA